MIFNNLEEYIKDKNDGNYIEKNELFVFIMAFVIIIVYLSSFNFSISNLISLIVAYYIIKVLYDSSKNHEVKKIKIKENKKKHIRPKSEIIEKYQDIVGFIFSINDLYVYNPPAFEEMVKSIESFFMVYEESIKIPELAHQNYKVADLKLNNAVNSLHSIILSSDADSDLDIKINTAYKTLYQLLNVYLDEIELVIKKDIKYNGYKNSTLVIDNKFKPYNYSEANKYIFDII
jgi:hypothetical protein